MGLHRKIVRFAAALFTGVTLAACQTTPAVPTPPPIDLTRNSDGTLSMLVNVDANGTYKVLLDTGSEKSAVNRRTANATGITTSGQKMNLHGLFSTGKGTFAPGHTISAGPFQSDPALIVLESDAALRPHGAHGIVGMDFLRSPSRPFGLRYVSLNFSDLTLSALPKLSFIQRQQKPLWVSLEDSSLSTTNLVMYPVSLSGLKGVAVLDSGLSMTVINSAMARDLTRRTRAEFSMLVDVNGADIAPAARITGKMTALGINWEGVIVVVQDAPAFKALGLADTPAMIMGANMLQNLTILIDLETGKLAALPPVDKNFKFNVGGDVFMRKNATQIN